MRYWTLEESIWTKRRIWWTIDGKTIELSYKEFELLTYFMENQRNCSFQRKDSEQRMEL